MSAPAQQPISLSALAVEDRASAEQILANALQLYAALPVAARAAMLQALQSSDSSLRDELARVITQAVAVVQLRHHRRVVLDQVERGVTTALPDLADDEAGAEAVRLIKEARER